MSLTVRRAERRIRDAVMLARLLETCYEIHHAVFPAPAQSDQPNARSHKRRTLDKTHYVKRNVACRANVGVCTTCG